MFAKNSQLHVSEVVTLLIGTHILQPVSATSITRAKKNWPHVVPELHCRFQEGVQEGRIGGGGIRASNNCWNAQENGNTLAEDKNNYFYKYFWCNQIKGGVGE